MIRLTQYEKINLQNASDVCFGWWWWWWCVCVCVCVWWWWWWGGTASSSQWGPWVCPCGASLRFNDQQQGLCCRFQAAVPSHTVPVPAQTACPRDCRAAPPRSRSGQGAKVGRVVQRILQWHQLCPLQATIMPPPGFPTDGPSQAHLATLHLLHCSTAADVGACWHRRLVVHLHSSRLPGQSS